MISSPYDISMERHTEISMIIIYFLGTIESVSILVLVGDA
jgi:hypothetical protein